MRIKPDTPIIIVKVKIGGKTGFRRMDMVLDTGATYTMIPWKVAEHLGYDPAGVKERTTITTASSVEKAPTITLDYIETLGKKASNIKVICHDITSLPFGDFLSLRSRLYSYDS
jgi:predicted aspartyl protease